MKSYDGTVLLMGFWIVLMISAILTSCLNRDMNRQLLADVTVSTEWLEFEPDPPLKPSRQVQMIVLVTADRFEPDLKTRGITLTGGAIAIPEIEIVDQYGISYGLKTQTVSGETEVGYWTVELPRDRVYPKVRLRSNHPIRCERVIWRCQNWE